jgi:hypothetical protein
MLSGQTNKPALGEDARLTSEFRQCLRCTPEPCVEIPAKSVWQARDARLGGQTSC